MESHPGAVLSLAVGEAFERCGSLLPPESDLQRQLELLSEGLSDLLATSQAMRMRMAAVS